MKKLCILSPQALGTFGLCQLYAFTQYLRQHLSPANFELLFKALITTLLATLGTAVVALTITGMMFQHSVIFTIINKFICMLCVCICMYSFCFLRLFLTCIPVRPINKIRGTIGKKSVYPVGDESRWDEREYTVFNS